MSKVKKPKKPLLVPFHGATGDMQTWAGYGSGPEEAGPSKNTIWWNKERALGSRYRCGLRWAPHPTHEPKPTRVVREHVKGGPGKHPWQYTVTEKVVANDEYAEQKARWDACLAEWNADIASGAVKEYPEYIWKENFEFDATLEIVGTFRGRSAARFILQNTEAPHERYEMMMTLVEDLLVNGECSKGKINGRWTFCKKGSNYSLKPVFADPKVLEEVPETAPEAAHGS